MTVPFLILTHKGECGTFVEPPVTRFYGEIAIVAVKAHLQGTFEGTPFAGFYRYLRVWLFQEERWQIVAGNVSSESCTKEKKVAHHLVDSAHAFGRTILRCSSRLTYYRDMTAFLQESEDLFL